MSVETVLTLLSITTSFLIVGVGILRQLTHIADELEAARRVQ